MRSADRNSRSRRLDLLRPPALDEAAVIFGRVDADARLVDDADGDRVAGLEHAELLELLGGFERRGGKRAEVEQELAAIGVEAQVKVGDRRRRCRSRVGKAVAVMGDRAAREVEGPACDGCRRP